MMDDDMALYTRYVDLRALRAYGLYAAGFTQRQIGAMTTDRKPTGVGVERARQLIAKGCRMVWGRTPERLSAGYERMADLHRANRGRRKP